MTEITSEDGHVLNTSIKVITYFLEQISTKRSKELKKDIENIFSNFMDG